VRSCIAWAASLTINAVFFSLLFLLSSTPDPRDPSPKLTVSLQGEISGTQASAQSFIAAAPCPDKSSAAVPRPDMPISSTALPALPLAAAVPISSPPRSDALSGTAGNTEAAGGEAAGGRVPGSGIAGVSAPGSGSAAKSGASALGEVAVLTARVSAALEARKKYPEAARRRGAEGVVALRLRVAEDGRLLAAKLAASSGSALLDRAALDLASSIFPVDNAARKELELAVSVRYELKR